MQQIGDNLYAGNRIDFINNHNREGFYIVNLSHKQHKKLLGYTPSPESEGYVYTIKDNCFSCNFIDSPDPKYYDYNNMGKDVFDMMFNFISNRLKEDAKVVVCCDQGKSRSIAVSIYYEHFIRNKSDMSFDEFTETAKSIGAPKKGILQFLEKINKKTAD